MVHYPQAFSMCLVLWLSRWLISDLSNKPCHAPPSHFSLFFSPSGISYPQTWTCSFTSNSRSDLLPNAFPKPFLWLPLISSGLFHCSLFAFAALMVLSEYNTVVEIGSLRETQLIIAGKRCMFSLMHISKSHWNIQMHILCFKEIKSSTFQLGHMVVLHLIIFIFY